MSLSFDQLDRNEKIALKVALVYPHRALSKVLPKFYGHRASKSTLYRYHREGVDELVSKGLLDMQHRPTNLAFNVIPEKTLREMAMKLHKGLTRLYNEKTSAENARLTAESELYKLKKHQRKLESDLGDLSSRLTSLSKSKIHNLMQRFEFLGIDENWVSVLVALNLVEMSMKHKLESLGTRPRGSFKELYDLLKREILAREKREIKTSSEFIKPKHLYDWRSKMDHDGLKVKIREKEADFIIEQAYKFIEELKIG